MSQLQAIATKFGTTEKELEIFELKQTMKKLQEMLLEYHDSIQYHCQEMRNLIFEMTKVDAEEVDASEFAGSLEKDVDYLKALKIHEARLMRRVKQIKEAKQVLRKRIAGRV